MLRISIDLARGFASLAVFLFHIADKIKPYSDGWFLLAVHGAYGVPLFFVISGYCIASSAEGFIRRRESPMRFLIKRFLRIYPPFWFSIVIILLVPYALELASYARTGQLLWPRRGWQDYGLIDWLQIVTLLRVFSGSHDQHLHTLFAGINPVYWSLAIEFQFYLVVFFGLLLRQNFNKLLWIVTAVSLFAAGLRNSGAFIGYWPLFALGVGLYYALKQGLSLDALLKHRGRPVAMVMLGLLMLAVVSLAWNRQLDASLSTRFTDPWLTFAILSTVGLWLMSSIEPLLARWVQRGGVLISSIIKGGVFLGGISYSLYLLHPNIYQVSEKISSLLSLRDTAFNPVIIVGGTIFLSWLFFLCFERPFVQSFQSRVE